jgi:SAM-dependent methyltransferase
MSLGERILTALSRDPSAPDYPGGTSTTTIDNCLDFIIKTVPNFLQIIDGKDVLDFGCGAGLQAAALAKTKARSVVGIDLPRPTVQEQWTERAKLGLANLSFTTDLPKDRLFDVVLSCSAFEHFADPAHILELMKQRCKPGGLVVITFAEPWLSPRGSHVDCFTRVPWVNVLFSEETVMKVRTRYRNDGAMRYEDVEGGLNRLTLEKFTQFMQGSGMKIRRLEFFPVKGLPFLSNIPVVREYMTAAASCILERQ